MTVEMKEVESTGFMPLSSVSQQHGDYLRFRIDPSPVLKRLQRLIGAKEWDAKSSRWVQDISREPMANDAFINDLMFVLEGYMNHNIIMGNLKSEEAHKITNNMMQSIIIMVAMRGKDYGIHPAKRSVIMNMIDDSVFITLTRAVNDGQRMHDDMNFRQTQHSMGRSAQMDGQGKT